MESGFRLPDDKTSGKTGIERLCAWGGKRLTVVAEIDLRDPSLRSG
jgi:hypothetical protein